MFKLNRLTDYAVVVMAEMAKDRPAQRSAGQIAAESGVPLPTVAKVLNLLARDGLVTAQRGAAGGYNLSRPAEQISVAEIVQSIEGPIALTACVEGALAQCDMEIHCAMRGNWDKVNQVIHQALTALTLADMTPCGPGTEFVPPAPSEPAAARTA